MNRGVPLPGSVERELGKGDSLAGENALALAASDLQALEALHQPLWLIQGEEPVGLTLTRKSISDMDFRGYIPALQPHRLGDMSFCSDHNLKFAYMAGAMANGIGSAEIVIAMGQAGMLGSFGAAGLDPVEVEAAILQIKAALPYQTFAVNLIHAPSEPAWEERVVDLFLKHKVHLVEASAYLNLSPAIVRYRTHGIHQDASGRIVTPHRVIGKVSRLEVANKFLAPPPEKILAQLVEEGHLTHRQAELARMIPMAQDLSAEADSGGHTDNRPALALLPTMQALVAKVQAQNPAYPRLRVGLGGGIATPASACAAFAMGAAFVLTGSVNQACREAGTSDIVREMLAQTGQADITMAPAADMFEMGVKLQVLKRGTMFAMRAAKLYEFYRTYSRLEDLPADDLAWLEKTIFHKSVTQVWQDTVAFFQQRDPSQIERANRDEKHKMALVFRWYLGQSSNWANRGILARKIDFQIWCGPAMGAFNEWTAGSHLALPEQRKVVAVAQNILFGAAVLTRAHQARQQGVAIPPFTPQPKPPEALKEYFS